MPKSCAQAKPLTNNQLKKVNTFIELALEFNKTHNIFVRTSKEEVMQKDINDCSPIINLIKPNNNIADLGSGGGFPGILLSITKPDNKITLIESNNKKCYFLRTVIDRLELKNAEVINQTITKNNNLERFDVITARAFASIEKIISLTQKNNKKETEYILLKGKEQKIKEELKLLDQKKYRYEIIKLDNENHERNIVVIKNE
ncbi:MAG: 16S rRNA (guanine(527)-N(7))-methyltransferase RsmG [Gammaproteobacteria bacterium TMED226]|nr:MAG: 16S rRNA (guanine(527)-N(7))-methyltransferase RsmG [Gammaproteobacteria bacterium TMED226]|tara:strand:+ start:214 stop:819 length:606 start_codon:yes stop_codon:yes gene_type:complete